MALEVVLPSQTERHQPILTMLPAALGDHHHNDHIIMIIRIMIILIIIITKIIITVLIAILSRSSHDHCVFLLRYAECCSEFGYCHPKVEKIP